MKLLKKMGVWLALILTLAACAWVKWQESSSEQSMQSVDVPARTRLSPVSLSAGKPRQMASQINTAVADVLLRPQPGVDAKISNLFTVYQPPQTVSPEPTTQAPQAPANPYSYAGELIEDGHIKVFLTDGIHNHAVQLGDVLEGTWRVQAISQLAVNLMYLPMKTMVTLPKGALN